MIKAQYIFMAACIAFQSCCAYFGSRKIVPLDSGQSPSSWSTPSMDHREQLANAVSLMQNTLFQNTSHLNTMNLGPKKKKKYKNDTLLQELLLKRLFLLFAMGPLQYKAEGEDEYKNWPFPLATALTQGQRVMVILDGIMAAEFTSFLTGGHAHLFFKRKYSSHGIRKLPNGDITEMKIKNPFRRVERTEKLWGMNFPLGGVGTRLPDGNLVGPYGREYSPLKGHLHKKKQIGHLHVYTQDFIDLGRTGVLVGIEGCAPGTSNQFGCNHNMFSGARNQKISRSTSGGLKWANIQADYKPPAEYNGKIIRLNRSQFLSIVERIEDILSKHTIIQKQIFAQVLQSSWVDANKFLLKFDAE